MYNKIKEYVNYQLRFDTSENNQEKKEEIIGNISDRYDEIFEKNHDENLAYVEAIKSMGDFTLDDKILETKEKSYKPNISEMFLIAGAILSAFGLLMIFLNVVAGAVVVMLSIISFSIGASYLYQESQYIKNEEYDIDKHNHYVNKIFSYMKTCFIFWAISISLLLTLLIYNLIAVAFMASNLGSITSIDDFQLIFFLLAIVFVILFLISLLIFSSLYKRLMKKYYLITGEEKLVSVGQKIKQFLFLESFDNKIKLIFIKNWFYPTFTLIFSLYCFVDLILLSTGTYGDIDRSNLAILISEFVVVVPTIIISIIAITGKFKSRFVAPFVYLISTIVIFILTFSLYSMAGPISFLSAIVLVVFMLIDIIVNLKYSQQKK